jgi:hypothetical protein
MKDTDLLQLMQPLVAMRRSVQQTIVHFALLMLRTLGIFRDLLWPMRRYRFVAGNKQCAKDLKGSGIALILPNLVRGIPRRECIVVDGTMVAKTVAEV